jgi:WD repeat-containing protein 35
LNENKSRLDLVKFYRKAKKNAEAARILNSLASDMIDMKTNPLVIKKVFVLAALEVHLFNKKNIDVNMTANLTNITLSDPNADLTKRALTTLITSDLNNISEKILTNPWRGAEAWHYLILSLRLLKKGESKQALKVALRLTNFELELGEERVNCLIAILAHKCQFYKVFSKALSRLEGIYQTKGNRGMVQKIEDLAVKTFSVSDPRDIGLENCETFQCINKNCTQRINEFDFFCKACGSNFSICVLSGNNIYVKDYHKCGVCQHKMLDAELRKAGNECCPLCHSKIKRSKESKVKN